MVLLELALLLCVVAICFHSFFSHLALVIICTLYILVLNNHYTQYSLTHFDCDFRKKSKHIQTSLSHRHRLVLGLIYFFSSFDPLRSILGCFFSMPVWNSIFRSASWESLVHFIWCATCVISDNKNANISIAKQYGFMYIYINFFSLNRHILFAHHTHKMSWLHCRFLVNGERLCVSLWLVSKCVCVASVKVNKMFILSLIKYRRKYAFDSVPKTMVEKLNRITFDSEFMDSIKSFYHRPRGRNGWFYSVPSI